MRTDFLFRGDSPFDFALPLGSLPPAPAGLCAPSPTSPEEDLDKAVEILTRVRQAPLPTDEDLARAAHACGKPAVTREDLVLVNKVQAAGAALLPLLDAIRNVDPLAKEIAEP